MLKKGQQDTLLSCDYDVVLSITFFTYRSAKFQAISRHPCASGRRLHGIDHSGTERETGMRVADAMYFIWADWTRLFCGFNTHVENESGPRPITYTVWRREGA